MRGRGEKRALLSAPQSDVTHGEGARRKDDQAYRGRWGVGSISNTLIMSHSLWPPMNEHLQVRVDLDSQGTRFQKRPVRKQTHPCWGFSPRVSAGADSNTPVSHL